jgi:two-component system nitrogen regulation response regulator GlnG
LRTSTLEEEKMSRILIADDEKDMRWLLSSILKEEGYEVEEADTGKKALALLKQSPPDLVLLDLKFQGGVDGIEVLKKIKLISPDTSVLILTAYGNIESAVQTIKLGAYDYLTKPFDNERLRLTIKRTLESQKLTREVVQLQNELKKDPDLESIMGKSQEIQKVFEQIRKVADTNFTILIEGESGTGKEIVANAIHRMSRRKNLSFIAVDCGAIPETLIESELFGYEKGAFTGADRAKIGQFELANNGTIFLDEISNLPYHVQNKLLRMIQERKIQKLGGKHTIPIDVRIIVASNTPLVKLVAGGKFRSDLFYRVNEFRIELPPLRRRIEDIPFLTKKFIEEGNEELQKNVKCLRNDSLTILINHSWPGNARELKNVIKRGVLLADSEIEPSHLIFESINPLDSPLIPEEKITEGISLREITKKTVFLAEKKAIEQILARCSGNKSRASKILKIDYKTLLTKIKEYNIKYGIDCMENVP